MLTKISAMIYLIGFTSALSIPQKDSNANVQNAQTVQNQGVPQQTVTMDNNWLNETLKFTQIKNWTKEHTKLDTHHFALLEEDTLRTASHKPVNRDSQVCYNAGVMTLNSHDVDHLATDITALQTTVVVDPGYCSTQGYLSAGSSVCNYDQEVLYISSDIWARAVSTLNQNCVTPYGYEGSYISSLCWAVFVYESAGELPPYSVCRTDS